jgi:parallel beta-helix repeat protein
MNWKAVSGMMLILLLIGMLTLAFDIQPVEANGTIYIRPDGSIDPPAAPIQRIGNVYRFTDDIYNKSIMVQIDDITLNGNGHLLQGPTTGYALPYGIYLSLRENVEITNIVISNGFTYGVRLDASSNCRIVNNNILGIDVTYGIALSESSHNLLTDNTIINTYRAIELEVASSYNTLSNNDVLDNTYGIWIGSRSLSPSTGNTLRNNVITGYKHSFLVYHIWLSGYIHDVDTSNTVDGKPIYYWINRHDESVPLDAGCVVIVNSSRINVKDLRLRNTGIGVCLAYTRDSVIENVRATTNFGPIWLMYSDSNVITRNNLTDNDGPGIFIERSNHNSVTDNFVNNSNSSGIWLEDCAFPGYNTLIGNTVLYSRTGHPGQEWDGAGILVDDSANCQVINNNLTRNSYGIVLGATPTTSNQISGNNIVMNDIGLLLGMAVYNTIYHNNFIENNLQVEFDSLFDPLWDPGTNIFDNGYPSGGNYWSDYSGADVKKGSNQDQLGSDGIGDTSYIRTHHTSLIDSDIQDRYPLMYPFGSPPPPTYTLTINAGANGATNPTPGTYTYSQGQNVSVQAIPDTGYILDHWELDGANIGTANPINVTMNADHMLHAVFILAHALTITTTAGGTTDPAPGTYTYWSGTTVSVAASPDTGYFLDRWELDGVYMGIPNPAHVTMNMNHTLHAVFKPLSSGHDVAVKGVSPSKTVVGHGHPLAMEVTALNVGSYTETFNVTAYANTNIIDTVTNITLTSGSSTIITLRWNTTGFAKGNYTITAHAEPVLGETDTTDNTLIDGWVMVVYPGDINGDGKVNVEDMFAVAKTFGSECGQPKYAPNCDINSDCKINVKDIFITAKNFGCEAP